MDTRVIAELAPTGILRAGVNLSNFLLVTGRSTAGDPEGVSPDLSRAVADRLGVPVRYVTYPYPKELADAAGTDAWDIGLIGAEPARAEKIAFTAAYAEIESTYLVQAGSPLKAIGDVDRPGIRIAVAAGSAYDLWLTRHIDTGWVCLRPVDFDVGDALLPFTEGMEIPATSALAARLDAVVAGILVENSLR